jgi:flagellar hook-basal body complex protein FliE
MAIEGILSAASTMGVTTGPTTGDSLSRGATSQGLAGAGSTGGSNDLVSVTGESGNGLDFGATLNRLVSAVESSNADANQKTLGMVDGTIDVHDAMIALQRADLTFQMTVQIRNKLVNAYQEMMRMPV